VISWGDQQMLDVAYTQYQVGEATQLILTFTGNDIYSYWLSGDGDAYSLKDGNYRISIDRDLLHSNAGDLESDCVDDFFRWFGDSDGNRTTAGNDMFLMRRLLAGDSTYERYKSTFDYNGDGEINATDFNQFRTRYGRRLLPPS